MAIYVLKSAVYQCMSMHEGLDWTRQDLLDHCNCLMKQLEIFAEKTSKPHNGNSALDVFPCGRIIFAQKAQQ